MVYKVFTDGASRGNPGEAGVGIAIFDDDLIIEQISIYLGKKTNNEAEYTAIVKALQKLDEMGIKRASFFSDSQLLVKQINGEYRVKAPTIKPLFEAVNFLLKGKEVDFNWIRRENNKIADSLANKAIDEK